MKKSLFSLMLICIMLITISGTLSIVNEPRVADSDSYNLRDEASRSSFLQSEPACACEQPELIVTLGGKLKLDYKEMNVCTMDDGSVLLIDRNTNDYFISKGGIIQGPFKQEDPRVAGFANCYLESNDMNDLLPRYKGILSKTGEKYLITMGGKTYGPFIEIYDFTVSRSRDKFVVMAVSKDGEMPKLITNIPDVTFDIVNAINSGLCGGIKYDEILVVTEDRILNLQGKTLFNIKPEMTACEQLFINSSNTRFAYYDFGTLIFSDGKSLPDCFNPHLLKSGSTVYLGYMYYSPKRNAIMQCKIPF